jgi:antitoxin HigA-1
MTPTESEIFEYPHGVLLPPIHPGRTVADELAERGLSPHAAALRMRIPPNRMSLIINESRAITAETALRLEALLGISAQFWMNLQTQYDLAVTKQQQGLKIAKEVELA